MHRQPLRSHEASEVHGSIATVADLYPAHSRIHYYRCFKCGRMVFKGGAVNRERELQVSTTLLLHAPVLALVLNKSRYATSHALVML